VFLSSYLKNKRRGTCMLDTAQQFWRISPHFLGAFAKLRKATVSFLVSVYPSVLMEHLGSHWTEFNEIWYLSIFLKSVEKIQISLKYGKNNGYFTWRPIYIYDHISLSSYKNEKCFIKKLQIKSKHTYCFQWFFLNKKNAVWVVWLIHIAYWIPDATDTRSKCVHLLLYHGYNGCVNWPQWYVYTYMACLFILLKTKNILNHV
jgi:hypothetical protein